LITLKICAQSLSLIRLLNLAISWYWIAFPSRLDPDAIAQSLEVSVDQLEPTEFTITELSDDALTCGDGQVGFMEQYSSAGETYVCATTKAAQI